MSRGPIRSLRRTCRASPDWYDGRSPVQYEGSMKDGRYLYFRARYGAATLGVGWTMAAAVAAAMNEPNPGLTWAARGWRWIDGPSRYPASGITGRRARALIDEMLEEILAPGRRDRTAYRRRQLARRRRNRR